MCSGSVREKELLIYLLWYLSNLFLRARSPRTSDAKLAGAGRMLSCPLPWTFGMLGKGFQNVEGLSSRHICHVDACHSGFVDFREGDGGWNERCVVVRSFTCWVVVRGWFMIVFYKIYLLDPKLTGACGFDVHLWIGRLHIKSNFVAKFNV